MAVNSRGPIGQPIFDANAADDQAADLTTLGSEAYDRGTRLVRDTTGRNQLVTDGLAYEGLAVWDTTDETEYVYVDGAWVDQNPFIWQQGTAEYGSNIAAGGSASLTVNFPHAFDGTPVLGALSCTSSGTQVTFWSRSLSNNSFVIQMRNFGSGSSTPGNFLWSARGRPLV